MIETPKTGNVVRIANRNPIEYTILACVEPYMAAKPGADVEFGVISDEGVSGSGWKSRLF